MNVTSLDDTPELMDSDISFNVREGADDLKEKVKLLQQSKKYDRRLAKMAGHQFKFKK